MRAQQHDQLNGKGLFAIKILMQAVVVAGAVFQEQRRRARLARLNEDGRSATMFQKFSKHSSQLPGIALRSGSGNLPTPEGGSLKHRILSPSPNTDYSVT